VILAVLLVTPAQAAFPGANGRIAFQRDSKDPSGLWTMKPDGTHLLHLPTGGGLESNPSWSPDGRELLFNCHCHTQDFPKVFTANEVGRDKTYVWDGFDVSWGADGRSLLASLYNPSPDFDGRFSIWRHELGTTTGTSLSHPTPAHGVDSTPAASADGNWIVFSRCCFKQPAHVRWNDLFIMASDGSGEARLTNNKVQDLSPDWDPDGSRIVFARGHHIALINPDGSHLVILTAGSHRIESSPAFSPDGEQIVFTRCCFGPGQTSEIFRMSVHGGELARLTHNQVNDWNPTWQPLTS
jgi:TolB protein